MNTKLSKLVVAIGALVMAGGAMAQSTATGTGTANATVIKPITIAAGSTLEFGNVVAGAGTVTVAAADGVRTDSDTALTPGGQKGTIRAATFNVAGEAASTYSITIPTTAITLSDSATTPNTMTATAFTVVAGTSGTVSGLVGTLAAGAGVLNVGATLNVAALQAPGAYTGTYLVTVAYN